MLTVSIIVPNYNHSRFIRQRLDSIFNQTYQDFEVILLDDASTDRSVEILSKYAGHPKVSHFIVNSRNSGSPFRQWKKGIELARGEYIWIAESDDWADFDFLGKATEYLNTNSKINMVYGKSMICDESGEILESYDYSSIGMSPERWLLEYENTGAQEINMVLYKRNTIPNASAVLFNRKAGLKCISKIQSFKMLGDWLFWILILLDGGLIYAPSMTNYFRVSNQMTRNHNSSQKVFYRYIEQIKLMRILRKLRIVRKEKLQRVHEYCIYKIQQSGYLKNLSLLEILNIPLKLIIQVLMLYAKIKVGRFIKLNSYSS